MISKKVLGKPRLLRRWLACRLQRMQTRAPLRGKIIVHIAFLDEGHGNSGRSVVCLRDARLERNQECRRREGGNLTTSSSLPASKLVCRSDSKFLPERRKQCSACPQGATREREGCPKTLSREPLPRLFNIALNLESDSELARTILIEGVAVILTLLGVALKPGSQDLNSESKEQDREIYPVSRSLLSSCDSHRPSGVCAIEWRRHLQSEVCLVPWRSRPRRHLRRQGPQRSVFQGSRNLKLRMMS